MTAKKQLAIGARSLLSLATIFGLALLCYNQIFEASTGLDASWVLGITKAAESHLVFGRDIIFTYGPLGFLIAGAKTQQSFVPIVIAHVAISLVLSALAFEHTVGQPPIKRAICILAIALTLPLMQSREGACVEAIIVFGMLTIAKSHSNRGRLCIAFGLFSGLASLTKFTACIEVIGSIGAMLVFDLVVGFLRKRSTQNELRNSLVFFMSFLNPIAFYDRSVEWWPGTALLVWALTLVCCFIYVSERFSAKIRQWAVLVAIGLTVVDVLSKNFFNFFAGALQISLGYSSAMINTGANPPAEVCLGVLFIALMIAIVTINRGTSGGGAAIGLVVVTWLNFKEGYVREDYGHVLEFLVPTAFLLAVCMALAKSNRAFGLCFLSLAVAVFSVSAEVARASPIGQKEAFSQTYSTNQVDRAFVDILQAASSSGRVISSDGLAPDRLDEKSRGVLENYAIDVQTRRINRRFRKRSPVEARADFPVVFGIHAGPRSNKCSGPRCSRSRDPLTVRHDRQSRFYGRVSGGTACNRCNYRSDPRFAGRLLTVSSGAQYIVLIPAKKQRCSANTPIAERYVTWDEVIPTPHVGPHDFLVASIAVRPSFWGRLVRTLYKSSDVELSGHLRDGRMMTGRLVPENAGEGFLLDPRPENTLDFGKLLSDQLLTGVDSISVHTDEKSLFHDDILISFSKFHYALH